MKFLTSIFKIFRLPIDFLLLTFHFIKGTSWLIFITIKKKLGFKTQPWPYGCFTQTTSCGRCACIPGRKYGNIFLFRSLCPDVSRYFESEAETFCIEKMQMTQFYWRPSLGRVFGVGLFLAMMWSTLGYGVYYLLPSTQKMKKVKAENHFAKAEKLAKEMKYERARLAYENAIKQYPKKATIHLKLGQCLLQLKRIKEGFKSFERAVQLNPGLWEGHLELARLMLKNRLYPSAFQHAQTVSKLKSEIVDAYLISASSLQKQGKIEEAKDELEKATWRLTNANAQQVELAASLYFVLKDLERAKELYQKAIEFDPGSINARTGLARVFITEMQWDSAIEQINLVLSKYPENAKALSTRAEMFTAKGEFQQAVDAYREVSQFYPEDPQPRTRIASLLYFANQKDKAAEILQTVLAEYPEYPDALLLISQLFLEEKRYRLAIANAERIRSEDKEKTIAAQKILGRAYMELKRFEEAITSCKAVLDAQPKEFTYMLLLAYCYHQLGEKDKAVAAYSKAAELNTESFLPDVYMANLFSEHDEVTSAINSYRRGLKKAPEEKRIANNLTMLLIERGHKQDIDEAFVIVSKLMETHRDDPIITDTFGWVLFHRGDYQQAEGMFHNAINLDPEIPDPHYHLGKTFLRQNKPEMAKERLERALELAIPFKGAKDAKQLLDEMQAP